MRFLCIFLRFYAILCQKLQNFTQLFAKSCERPCKNFVLVFDFVAVSQNSPAKSRCTPIRSARRGAAAAGRGTERPPRGTPRGTPDRTAWRPEERKAAPKGHPEGHPEGHPAAGSMVLACVMIVCGVLPKGHPTAWLGGPRNVRPPPKGHPEGHPAAGSMVLACVLIVCGLLCQLICR